MCEAPPVQRGPACAWTDCDSAPDLPGQKPPVDIHTYPFSMSSLAPQSLLRAGILTFELDSGQSSGAVVTMARWDDVEEWLERGASEDARSSGFPVLSLAASLPPAPDLPTTSSMVRIVIPFLLLGLLRLLGNRKTPGQSSHRRWLRGDGWGMKTRLRRQ